MSASPFRESEATEPLPANIAAEQALLGAILVDNSALRAVRNILRPPDFGLPVHGRIYAAATAAIERGISADPVALRAIFDCDEALSEQGGGKYLGRLAATAVTTINARCYAEIIADLAQRRAAIFAAEDLRRQAFDVDPDRPASALLDDFGRRLDEIRQSAKASPIICATPFTWAEPAAIPKRQFLYGRHLARRFVSATIGASGLGKSGLTTAEAVAMIENRAILGDAPAGRLRVWQINLEDPEDELRRRIAAAAIHYGADPLALQAGLFVDSGRNTEMILASDARDGLQIAVPAVEAIRKTIAANAIDAVTVDPFVQSHSVPENDNGKIAAVVRLWAGIAEATGCAIDLVHHARKSAPGQSVTVEDARGASAFIAAVRSARVLNGMTKDEAERAGVDNPRLYFSVINGKSNLAPPPDKATWRRLVRVRLGNGTAPEDPGDEVAVVEPWNWPDAFAEVSPDDAREVQRRIAKGEWRADQRSTIWAGIAVADVLDLDVSQPAVRATVRTMLKTWVETGALCEVERRDGSRKPHRFVEVGALLP